MSWRLATVPKKGDYLTDGERLVRVLMHDANGRLLCEDAKTVTGIVRIRPVELGQWRRVVPLADAA